MKKIALIGCTGSIGRQVIDVVRHHHEFAFSALVCGTRREELAALCGEFHPRIAFCAADGLPMPEDLFSDCDVAFIAAGGFAGLKYTLAAIGQNKTVALANKESLVCGGELVMKAAKEHGVEIVPVDSEHSALFQALSFRRDAPFRKLILTASGGPFRTFSAERLRTVTPAEALAHPTWKMGKKVTVDSATLLNKGYEVLEAHHLYGAPYEAIEVVVHPESIVHSLVAFCDGAVIAELAYPDMRLPIQLALTYPERLACLPELDLVRLGSLHFERLPAEKFPCFGLALAAGRTGGTAPTLLNGAAETAVNAFLAGSLSFCGIAAVIEETLSRIPSRSVRSFEDLEEADRAAREFTHRYLYEQSSS